MIMLNNEGIKGDWLLVPDTFTDRAFPPTYSLLHS